MAAMCGTAIPAWMDRLFEGLDDHPASRQLVAATITAELCRRLYAEGVRHFHFYTLNRAELAFAICHLLGVRGTATKERAAACAMPISSGPKPQTASPLPTAHSARSFKPNGRTK